MVFTIMIDVLLCIILGIEYDMSIHRMSISDDESGGLILCIDAKSSSKAG